ncbi:MAG: competence/damage-inducible protein A [Crocinitomicaceae bacterium]|nr:competence/damage-inducible protein A [Crocinitomicaceae bacterium]
MRVEVIAIGDELLIGQTINTNASWIGSVMAEAGGTVQYATVIQDKEDAILYAIEHALSRVDLVIVTGGLGPTKDDITKHTLCKFFDTSLEINEEILTHVRSFFAKRGREMLDVNIQQAAMPMGARILKNNQGTASGMLFERDGKLLVSLPGVPYEMKHLLRDRLLPILEERFEMESIYHQTIYAQGIGESYLAERIKDIEDEVRGEGIGLAYLPSPGIVRLRLTSERTEHNKKRIDHFLTQISDRLPMYVFGREAGLAKVVGELLKGKQKTLGTAESCTAGSLSSEIVKVSGASEFFYGSFVTYTNKLKQHLLDVREEDLKAVGAVSEEVVKQMAANGRVKLGVDYCLALSGIAGPNGGSIEKPVGTIWIALASKDKVITKQFLFGDQRDRNIRVSVLTALNMLRCELLEINYEKSV